MTHILVNVTHKGDQMTHRIEFTIKDFDTGEHDVMVISEAPEPITASDMLEYFIRFCVVAGYQIGSVDDAIVEYASDVENTFNSIRINSQE